jgi:farnesyl-diphosphate farnesyltransferase
LDTKRVENVLPSAYALAGPWLNSLSSTERTFVQNVVLSVIKGMIMDLETFGDSIENVRAFSTNNDLETYIGWIGGEPGRFWTNLLLHHALFPRAVDRNRLFEGGMSFGKGLQMVNILKDVPEDLKRGRCYIPQERLGAYGLTLNDLLTGQKKDIFLTLYQELLDETVKRLENGLWYINQFGVLDLRLRASVWWPLVLGLKTIDQLRTAQDVLAPGARRKIKRTEVYIAILMSVFFLPWEKGLRSEFERLT